MVLAGDIAVVSDRATFRAPELLRGVADCFLGARLATRVGMAQAKWLLFTARALSAAEAQRIGLVSRVVPHATLADKPDLLLVPGGGWARGEPTRGTRHEYERGVVPAAIAQRHAAGSKVGSVCTGAMLLAKAGLVEGRPATTHWAAIEDLRAHGADVHPEARVVDDGDLLTCGGVTSGLDLALHLVEQVHGPEAAEFAARLVEHDRRQEVFTGSAVR